MAGLRFRRGPGAARRPAPRPPRQGWPLPEADWLGCVQQHRDQCHGKSICRLRRSSVRTATHTPERGTSCSAAPSSGQSQPSASWRDSSRRRYRPARSPPRSAERPVALRARPGLGVGPHRAGPHHERRAHLQPTCRGCEAHAYDPACAQFQVRRRRGNGRGRPARGCSHVTNLRAGSGVIPADKQPTPERTTSCSAAPSSGQSQPSASWRDCSRRRYRPARSIRNGPDRDQGRAAARGSGEVDNTIRRAIDGGPGGDNVKEPTTSKARCPSRPMPGRATTAPRRQRPEREE